MPRPYAAEVLSDNPVAYWRLGETSGTTAFDFTGKGRNGTYQGTPSLNQQPGIGEDRAVLFDGVDDYISVPDHASLAPASISVELWVAFSVLGGSNGSWVNRRGPVNIGGFTIEGYAGGTSWFVNIAGTWYQTLGPSPGLNVWHHMVGTYTSGDSRLYMDGALVAQTAPTGALNNPAGAVFEIGRSLFNSVCFPGQLDEIAIYDYALPAARVTAHAIAGGIYTTGVLADRPVGYWRLGESSGAVNDSSGSNNHGSHAGSPVYYYQPGALLTDDNRACSFTPTGTDYVTIPANASMAVTTAFTIEGWLYLRATQATGVAPCIFSTRWTGVEGGIAPVLGFGYGAGEENRMFVGFFDGAAWRQCFQNGTFPLNRWVHVAGVYSAGFLSIYMDGVVSASNGGHPATIPALTNAARHIGKRWDIDHIMDGVIDEVALYNSALPAQTIARHYARGRSRYASEVMSDAPLGYWRFGDPGELGGAYALDGSGYGRHGSFGGGVAGSQPGLISGDPSTSVSFDGATGNVVVPSLPTAASGDWTLEAHVVPSTLAPAQGGCICSNGTDQGGYSLHMSSQFNYSGPGTRLVMCVNGWGWLDGGYDFTSTTVPVHVVVRRTGTGTIAFFVNGVPRGTGSSGITTPALRFHIGAQETNANNGTMFRWFAGRIDEVAIYGTALSDARIAAHYAASRVAPLQRYDGAAWAAPTVRRWDGTQWVVTTPRRWDGAAWT